MRVPSTSKRQMVSGRLRSANDDVEDMMMNTNVVTFVLPLDFYIFK